MPIYVENGLLSSFNFEKFKQFIEKSGTLINVLTNLQENDDLKGKLFWGKIIKCTSGRHKIKGNYFWLLVKGFADCIEKPVSIYLYDKFAEKSDLEHGDFIAVSNAKVNQRSEEVESEHSYEIICDTGKSDEDTDETLTVWIMSKTLPTSNPFTKRGVREINFTQLSQLKPDDKFMICAVIMSASSIRPTTGRDSICQLLIRDKSCGPGPQPASFSLNIFVKDNADLPEFHVGDIIRCPIRTDFFNNRVSGKVFNARSCLFWSSKSDGTLTPRTGANSYHITIDDIRKLTELRQWVSKNFPQGILPQGISPPEKPKLTEFSSVLPGTFFNVICQVAEVPVPLSNGNGLALRVWDGTQPQKNRLTLSPTKKYVPSDTYHIIKDLIVDVSVFGQHVNIANKFQAGNVIILQNVHCTEVKNTFSSDFKKLKFELHEGNRCGRSIKLCSKEDSADFLKKLDQQFIACRENLFRQISFNNNHAINLNILQENTTLANAGSSSDHLAESGGIEMFRHNFVGVRTGETASPIYRRTDNLEETSLSLSLEYQHLLESPVPKSPPRKRRPGKWVLMLCPPPTTDFEESQENFPEQQEDIIDITQDKTELQMECDSTQQKEPSPIIVESQAGPAERDEPTVLAPDTPLETLVRCQNQNSKINEVDIIIPETPLESNVVVLSSDPQAIEETPQQSAETVSSSAQSVQLLSNGSYVIEETQMKKSFVNESTLSSIETNQQPKAILGASVAVSASGRSVQLFSGEPGMIAGTVQLQMEIDPPTTSTESGGSLPFIDFNMKFESAKGRTLSAQLIEVDEEIKFEGAFKKTGKVLDVIDIVSDEDVKAKKKTKNNKKKRKKAKKDRGKASIGMSNSTIISSIDMLNNVIKGSSEMLSSVIGTSNSIISETVSSGVTNGSVQGQTIDNEDANDRYLKLHTVYLEDLPLSTVKNLNKVKTPGKYRIRVKILCMNPQFRSPETAYFQIVCSSCSHRDDYPPIMEYHDQIPCKACLMVNKEVFMKCYFSFSFLVADSSERTIIYLEDMNAEHFFDASVKDYFDNAVIRKRVRSILRLLCQDKEETPLLDSNSPWINLIVNCNVGTADNPIERKTIVNTQCSICLW